MPPTAQHWVIGVDLGGTKIALGLIDPQDRIVTQQRIATAAEEGPVTTVARIAVAVEVLSRHLPAGASVDALGICTPGPVNHVTGMLIDPPNLPGLHNAPLRDTLSARLGIPVCLEHDAKAAALGEFHYGAGRGERSMVYIVVGTGVGSAIILDGHLYRGAHNSAGEIGHTMFDPDGDLCACGSRGCVETHLAGPWLARRYKRARRCEPALGRAVSAPEGDTTITGEGVARRAQNGDKLAQQVMTGAGKALGVAVATMAMVLDVDFYVIGGSVSKAGELLLAPARETMPHHCYKSVGRRVRIVASELGDDGPILGCGWLARQRLAQT
ncbi:MAG: ROK family protein [Anaerolineae bacterium]|nr:ROK family protein [Anaerolineae bacterium]